MPRVGGMMGIQVGNVVRYCCTCALLWPGGAFAEPPLAPITTSTETVIVTADKRIETAQSVPGGLTILTGDNLGELHARGFQDLAGFVPGLSYQSTTPANNLIAIRGVTTGGTQLGSAIGLYLDDVPVGATTSFGLGAQSLDINTFDLNRMEILNGPQGTLYGANSLGGALKYVTAAPDPNAPAAYLQTGVAGVEQGVADDRVGAMLNLPFLSGRAAIRMDGIYTFDAGFMDDPDHGRKHLGGARTTGGRVSLLVQFSPAVDLRLGAFSQSISANGLSVSDRDPVTHAPVQGPYDQSFPLDQPSVSSLQLYSGVLHWNLDWAKFTAVTGYQYDHGRSITDESLTYDAILRPIFGAVAANPYALPVVTNTKKFSEEIRLASSQNQPLEWLIGGFYSREQTHEVVDLVNAADTAGNLFGFAPFNSALPSSYRELAVFADGTVRLTNRFDLTLGVRYSQNHQDYQQISFGLFNNPAAPDSVSHLQAASDQSVMNYLIAPRYRLTDAIMLYGRISSGYRPGGPNFVLAPGLGNPVFKPDHLLNYEVGEKASILAGRGTINLDIYDIEWSAIQLTVNHGGVNQLENAGDARIQGAETSFSYRLLPNLAFWGSAAYTNARLVTTATAIGINYTGARLPISPNFQFALSANYDFPVAKSLTGSITISDAYLGNRTSGFAGSAISPLYKLPGYSTLNGAFTVTSSNGVRLGIYADNLFDTRGEVSANTTANEYAPAASVPVALSRPRTIGLRLEFGGVLQGL